MKHRNNLIPRILPLLLLLAMGVPTWAADYVIVKNGNYYDGTTAGTTTFDPQTCIWTGTSGGSFTNGAGTTLTFNNNSRWTLSNNRFQYTTSGWGSNTTYYIGYSSSTWQRVTRTNNAASVYPVSAAPNNTTIIGTAINGSEIISENTQYSATAMGQRCTTYIWTGNSGITAGCQSIELTSGVTYTWSVSGYTGVSISNAGVLSINTRPTADQQVTITLNATYGGQTKSATKQVTILGTTPAAPTISNYLSHVTISKEVSSDVIRYTTDGSTPTCSTGTVYTGRFDITTLPVTIKAIACRNGNASSVASKTISSIPTTGVSGTTVTLMDWEDIDGWTYYTGVNASVDNGNYNNNYLGKLYSPDARNIIIEYRGGSVTGASAVAISALANENQNTMIYYQTMEKDRTNNNYPYTVIPNPFSKRPRTNGTSGTNGFWGFNGWKIIQGGDKINGYSNNQTLPLDADITFTSSLANYDHIILEATWVAADVQRQKGAPTFSGGTYETNFWVLSGAANSSALSNLNQNMTISARYPDGSSSTTSETKQGISVESDFEGTVKLEYIPFSSSSAVEANGRNLFIGRGVTNGNATGGALQFAAGNSTVNQIVRIESGKYSSMKHYTAGQSANTITKQYVILGCDYDRANNNNSNLSISGQMAVAGNVGGTGGVNLNSTSDDELCRVWAKSGSFCTSVTVTDASAVQCYYVGSANTHNSGHRYLEIQGGVWKGIAGGMCKDHEPSKPAFTFRMRGGTIEGALYGSGAYANAGGTRRYVITGGEIWGWVAAGCNGIGSESQNPDKVGKTDGDSYVYIGGNVKIGYQNKTINSVAGGNVFGAGRGAADKTYAVGQMNNTNMVVADKCEIENNVYGGGNYGLSLGEANIYVTGGTVDGNVFGGANMKDGYSPEIRMFGGNVKTGIYGGCNTQGTINNSTFVRVYGGKVGVSTNSPAHICGGGFGSATRVTNNVEVTIGGTATVYGEVYGGSEQGLVNTDATNAPSSSSENSKHTYVSVTGGTINGAVYGGGLGTNANAANTYGDTKVTISGGIVNGNVFGCNNVNGRPFDSKVEVLMSDGTVKKHVFGGGNQAGYTGDTEVKILGGTVEGNVYGGGYGTDATVTGNTNVQIGQ